MSIDTAQEDKIERIINDVPNVTIFLRPIAAPAALGLAGFAGATWISSTWVANWWGSSQSPSIYFPFLTFFGGLAQFIAGLYGFQARDVLVTVIHGMWGSFWMSIGLLYFLTAAHILPQHNVHDHYPELASWSVVLAFFTWSGAIAAAARDVVLCGILTSLAIGETIAISWFAFGNGVNIALKVAAYFWILSSILAWWRVTVYFIEEAYGKEGKITKFFPVFRTPMEKRAPLIVPGLGEPGVKRGMPGLI